MLNVKQLYTEQKADESALKVKILLIILFDLRAVPLGTRTLWPDFNLFILQRGISPLEGIITSYVFRTTRLDINWWHWKANFLILFMDFFLDWNVFMTFEKISCFCTNTFRLSLGVALIVEQVFGFRIQNLFLPTIFELLWILSILFCSCLFI